MNYYTVCCSEGAKVAAVGDFGDDVLYRFFSGYDFMGSVDWTTDENEATIMDFDEAEQIVKDLESSDDECMQRKAEEAAYKKIEDRRKELNILISAVDDENDPDFRRWQDEWKSLHDEEMNLDMKYYAIAAGQNEQATIFVRTMYECGWAICTKVNGEWDYNDGFTAVDAMKEFKRFAKEHRIKTVHVESWLLDIEALREIDKKHAEYADQEEYATACQLSEYYDDDSYLERYYRKHEEE